MDTMDLLVDNEIAFEGINGSPSYLWRDTGCTGPYGTGCFRLSVYQNESKCTQAAQLKCHLKDASHTSKAHPYHIIIYLRQWHRVSHIGTEQRCKLAKDKTVVWLNGIAPVESAYVHYQYHTTQAMCLACLACWLALAAQRFILSCKCQFLTCENFALV